MKIESEKTVSTRMCQIMYAERKLKGISQTQLCQELKITQGLLSKIENEKLTPSAYVWLTFCQLFALHPNLAMEKPRFQKRMQQLKKDLKQV